MPDIGFRLFGDSVALERAIVRGKNAVGGLDKDLKGVNKVMGTLGKVTGAFGITQAFSAAINKAQQLRDESLKNKTAIDSGTAALARYGDTIDKLKEGAVKMGVSILGSLSNFGERLGAAIRGEDIDAARAEEAASKKRLELTEKDMAIRKEVFELRKKQAYEEADTNGKINLILKEQVGYMNLMNDSSADENKRLDAKRQFELNQLELRKQDVQVQKEKIAGIMEESDKLKKQNELRKDLTKKYNDAAGDVKDARNALDESNADRSRMTLQELASVGDFQAGVSIETSQKARVARDVMGEESKAKQLTSVGDLEGSKAAQAHADELRGSLAGTIKSAESDPSKGLKDALKESEAKLQVIADTLKLKFANE